MEDELFGERHEQEENGLFGRQHEKQLLNLFSVSKPKANCKHYVKNWDAKRGTYLCSGCGKDFTDSL